MKREIVYDVIMREKRRGHWIESYMQDDDEKTYREAFATYCWLSANYGARDDIEYELVKLTYEHDDNDLCEIGELVDSEIIYCHSCR